MNRKVRNATAVSIDGISFKSKAEGQMYLILKDSRLDFSYEPEAITLLEGFSPVTWHQGMKERRERVRPMTYTPDFVVKAGGKRFLIEVKGLPTDRYIVKRKLLLYKLKDMAGTEFWEVHTKGEMLMCVESIKEHDSI